MSTARLKNAALDLSGVTAIEVKPGILAFVFKAIAVPMIAAGLDLMAMGVSTVIGVFYPPYGVKSKIWDNAGFVFLGYFWSVWALYWLVAAAQLIFTNNYDERT